MRLMVPIDTPPQGRPRFTRTGRVYDPPKSRKFKEDFAQMILPKISGHQIFTGAIRVELRIYRNKKSAIRRNFGDADNLAKPILDAITMTGAVWEDDSQIVDLRIMKATAPEPHVELIIEEVEKE